jgi:3-dehydroquinate dehydratase-1
MSEPHPSPQCPPIPGKICVSIGVEDTDEALRLLGAAGEHADLVEIRLDLLADPDPAIFVEVAATPLLFTCRPRWEGGFFDGDEDSRVELLRASAQLGAAYVDIELRAPTQSRDRVAEAVGQNHARLILSWHDFNATPERVILEELVRRMHGQGAQVGKIVTTANTRRDMARVLGLQDVAGELDFPLVSFCMGEIGMFSRVATLLLGGYMSYCSPEGAAVTASGQIEGGVLREMINRFGRQGERHENQR